MAGDGWNAVGTLVGTAFGVGAVIGYACCSWRQRDRAAQWRRVAFMARAQVACVRQLCASRSLPGRSAADVGLAAELLRALDSSGHEKAPGT